MKFKDVYFFLNKKKGAVKIGSSVCPSIRMRTVGFDVKTELELLYVFLGGGERKEREFHIRFKDYRIRGEWFRYSKDIKDFILDLKKNNLVWIGDSDWHASPKPKMISTAIDKKTYDDFMELADKSGRSMASLARLIFKQVIENEKLNEISIVKSYEYLAFYYMRYKKITYFDLIKRDLRRIFILFLKYIK